MCEFIDTFPAFLDYWTRVHDQPVADQIETWATQYLAPWPELLSKQTADYASQNVDWRQIARERVFPHLAERLPAMQQAHQHLLETCEPVYARAQQKLGFDSPAVFVVYVGIGCGAGWLTTYGGAPAILFGLENIAECGWSGRDAIAGLMAHETGHLAHYHWRAQHALAVGTDPWWQLYEEGFAQRCESAILDTATWHQSRGRDANWSEWCRDHRAWLAAQFVSTVDAGKPVNPFFGSWFEIEGRSQTGYYLGCEVIRTLEQRFTLKEIALLENVAAHARPILEQWSGDLATLLTS
jgi:hypothetical protein